jgi:endonuclease-8
VPEGDTVWRTARRLAALDGQRVVKSDFRIPSLATRDLSGATFLETVSRGKHLLTRFDNDVTVHSHLKMEGAWSVQPAGSRWRRPAHQARLVLRTATDEAIAFQITLDLLRTREEHRVVGHLGPDLLGPDWDQGEAVRRLREHPEEAVADALLEQRNLAGIGNVYKAELCFIAGVHPRTRVEDIPDLEAVVSNARLLLESNKDRHDRNTTGDPRRGRGLWVYRRRGPCLRCGTPIRSDEQGPAGRERATWWCPTCQSLPNRR